LSLLPLPWNMKYECPLPIKEIENEINQERGVAGLFQLVTRILTSPSKNIQFSYGLSVGKLFKLIFF
jgi:hypothetical protein